MQGFPEQRPGRRAGDTSRHSAPGKPEMKEWQKQTVWTGPVPENTDPFDEPANSPELEEDRSENVREHVGEFWNDLQATGYQDLQNTQHLIRKTGNEEKEARERRISIRAAVIFVLLLTAAVLVLFFGVFRIREIRVVGNEVISAEDVIRFSGIRRGESILLLSEKDTEDRLQKASSAAAQATGNYNYYRLQFRYLEKEMPGTVVIAIKEREACCWLDWCGIKYVLDKKCMVLFETEQQDMAPDLVQVKGLEIRSGSHAGQHMVLSSGLQESIFQDLFMEMNVLQCTGEIQEVDLSNTASILLTTKAGFTVAMGSREDLHAKIRSLLLVQQELLEMGITGGSISVINPQSPFYSPSAQ